MNIGHATGNVPNFFLNDLLTDGKPHWQKIEAYDWVNDMKNCPQDSIHHAEGDVWTHTRMVVDEILNDADFKALDNTAQYILFLSALLHDIAKPVCTFEENGRIFSPKHAVIGEKIVRELLWNADFEQREKIAALVRLHGLPIWCLEKINPYQAAIAASLRIPNIWLYILAKADINGRICSDKADLMYKIELFKDFCLENDCFYTEKYFHDEYSRFKFFQTASAMYPVELFDNTEFDIFILSGIAGSGKDSFYEKNWGHLPLVSLDNLRQSHKIKSTDKDAQGKIAQLAYEKAKEYCRKKQSFVWNSTNLTLELRSKLINTLSVYNPKFHIYYVETSKENIFARREKDIPKNILWRMIKQLDLPLLTEAHFVNYERNN